MQFESIIDSKAPKNGRPAEPAYMIFSPDEGEYFQLLSSGRRRTPAIEVSRGNELRVPMNGEDVTPLREAKNTRNDEELLSIIRKYVQTHGLGVSHPDQDSLKGTVHTLPEGSIMLRGRIRYDINGQLNELPTPRRRYTD